MTNNSFLEEVTFNVFKDIIIMFKNGKAMEQSLWKHSLQHIDYELTKEIKSLYFKDREP